MSEADELLAGALIDAHPLDAAGILERFPPGEVADALGAMPTERVAAVLGALTSPFAARVALASSPETVATALASVAPEVAATLLLQLEADEREALRATLPGTARSRVDRVLAQPPGSAGRLMSPLVVTLDGELSAGDALEAASRAEATLPYYLYAVERPASFLGIVELPALLGAAPDSSLRSVMRSDVRPIAATASERAVIEHPAWLSVHALPVVADGNALVGAIEFATLHRLRARAGGSGERELMAAALAFGELYWVGLTRAVDVIAAASAGAQRRSDGST